MSMVTCQKVTNGIQRMSGLTSGPSGSRSQSGWFSSRSNDHQVIGSLACCQ